MAEAFFLRYGSEGYSTLENANNINIIDALKDKAPTDCTGVSATYAPKESYNSLDNSSDKLLNTNAILCAYKNLAEENKTKLNSNSVSSGSIDDIQSRYANMHLKVYNLGFGIALMMAYIFSKT
jgi:hypothetical protein